jgi:uncharacterized membrane protein
MFGKNDAEKYQALFGILALISLFLITSSNFFAYVFLIFLIAAIAMVVVEKYGEKTKSTPLKFNIAGIVGTIFIIILVASVFSGNQQNSEQSMKYYNEGVNSFNKGVSFFNEGVTSLNKKDTNTAIAKFELSNDFFRQAKTNYETAMWKLDTNSNMNSKAKYMMQSSDYYSKGIDEYIGALRLLEKYEGTNLLTTGVGVILNPESITSITSELSEIKIKSEKAKNYFDLAKNAKESAEKS